MALEAELGLRAVQRGAVALQLLPRECQAVSRSYLKGEQTQTE